MLKFIKKNIGLIVIAMLILALLIFIYMFFYSSSETSKYGIRIIDSKDYKMSKKEIEKLEKIAKQHNEVNDVEILCEGKIIRIIISYNKDVSITDMQKIFSIITENISKNILSYYDISYLSTKKGEKEDTYPLIGYKNSYEETIIWESNE